MLTSSHGGAVVTGRRGEYLGVVDFDTVTGHMRAIEEQVQTAGQDEPEPSGDSA